MKFGSHLYGTDTPNSDLDFKSVYAPPAQAILLQRVANSGRIGPEKMDTEKNKPGDVEEEMFSLQRFLKLAAEGNTVAIDMLFAPADMILEQSPEWSTIIDNRHRLLTKKSKSFVGYCQKQAAKYGVKGSRVAAARRAYDYLDARAKLMGPRAKLAECADYAEAMCAAVEHMQIVEKEQPGGTKVRYWDVCGRLLQYTGTIYHARDVMKTLVDEYGHRALQAESNEGVDWKALSHAVRVGEQAIELLRTGHVTFPLRDRAYIRDVKKGLIAYKDVASVIERLLEEVETAAANSTLPEEPDLEWIDEFVARTHMGEVISLSLSASYGGGFPA